MRIFGDWKKTRMSDDFRKLMEDIEAEAKAAGPAAEAELRELRREFSIASQLMTLRREQKLTRIRPEP